MHVPKQAVSPVPCSRNIAVFMPACSTPDTAMRAFVFYSSISRLPLHGVCGYAANSLMREAVYTCLLATLLDSFAFSLDVLQAQATQRVQIVASWLLSEHVSG